MGIHGVITAGVIGVVGVIDTVLSGLSHLLTPTTPITPTTCVDLVGAGRHLVLRKIFVIILDLSADLRD